jgi:hypothetical protein
MTLTGPFVTGLSALCGLNPGHARRTLADYDLRPAAIGSFCVWMRKSLARCVGLWLCGAWPLTSFVPREETNG